MSSEHHPLVEVGQTSNPMEAEIIKGALDAEGIFCFLDGLHQAGLSGLSGLLQVKIMVREPDAERATSIVNEHQTVSAEEAGADFDDEDEDEEDEDEDD